MSVSVGERPGCRTPESRIQFLSLPGLTLGPITLAVAAASGHAEGLVTGTVVTFLRQVRPEVLGVAAVAEGASTA